VILVTVGMHTDGFPRLVKEMDRIAQQTSEEVVMQIGATQYKPAHAQWFTFGTQAEIDALSERADVIVSHAGAGSILTVLRYRKPMIVMPRLSKYGEHMDDHQLELAEALSQAGVLLMANDGPELLARLQQTRTFRPRVPDHTPLVHAVRQAVLAGEGWS
jgi:beta-1,4-N-acetylglucosaminyltransferase